MTQKTGLITGKIAAIVNIADHDIRGTKRERWQNSRKWISCHKNQSYQNQKAPEHAEIYCNWSAIWVVLK